MIVINKDVNASPAAYRQYASAGQLLVTSIFRTIQGEGPYAGQVSVFLRLAGCNIGEKEDCPWCDTQFSFAKGMILSVEAVADRIRALADNAGLVVVTGGEPLLQWQMMLRLGELAPDFVWQFETNGLLLKPDVVNQAVVADMATHFVVSPKVPANLRRYPLLREEWSRLGRALSLKYVVEADPESTYYMPGPTGDFNTYISGMAVYHRATLPGEVASIWDQSLVDRAATARNYRHAAGIVLASPNKYRLSLQTHLFAGVE
jgi:7-carboxy-7-deazaguanine synthase